MKNKSFLQIFFIFCSSLILTNFAVSIENSVGSHGGRIFHSDGHIYELVQSAPEKRLKVYTPDRKSNTVLPNVIIVKVKKNHKTLDRLHLVLIQNADSESPSYITKLPTNILISAGVTFEIDF